MKYNISAILFILLVLASSCRRTPGYVVPPDRMAQVMADLYIGEAYVEQSRGEFSTDSARQALKQEILGRHGVSLQQFDTTMMWYGHHMDRYLDVCNKTIKVLEDRERQAGNMITAANLAIAGDSVDVWMYDRYAHFTPRMQANVMSFDISYDDNWEDGDVYTWRFKQVDDVNLTKRWRIYANYADSTSEWLDQTLSTKGWNMMVIPTDSTRQLVRLRGSVEFTDNGKRPANDIWLDSIQLIRRRANPDNYTLRYRMRKYKPLR